MPSGTKNFVGRNYKRRRSKDRISKATRSRLMSRIRSKNTGLEKRFFALLRKHVKVRFKTHAKDLRGKPDVVFPDQRLCVFVDGDFWHGWQYPRWKHQMKNKFWRDKIETNRKRDNRNRQYLRRKGWKVLRVWEHQVSSNSPKTIDLIKATTQ